MSPVLTCNCMYCGTRIYFRGTGTGNPPPVDYYGSSLCPSWQSVFHMDHPGALRVEAEPEFEQGRVAASGVDPTDGPASLGELPHPAQDRAPLLPSDKAPLRLEGK